MSEAEAAARTADAPQYPRTARLNELLREIVAEELERIDDERLELVAITVGRRRRRPAPRHRVLRRLRRRGDGRRGARGARRCPGRAAGRDRPPERACNGRPMLDVPARRPAIRTAERVERDPARAAAGRQTSRRRLTSSASMPDGFVVVDKPAGLDHPRRRGRAPARSRRAAGRPRRHARPRRHRRAARRPRPGDPSAAVPHRAAEDVHRPRSCSASRPTRSTPSGATVAMHEMPVDARSRRSPAAATLTGPIKQVPPMVSAVKVGGRRLHELAREGDRGRARAAAGDRPPLRRRRRRADPLVYRVAVECSSGTYVRSLAADLGHAARRRRAPRARCAAPRSARSPRPRRTPVDALVLQPAGRRAARHSRVDGRRRRGRRRGRPRARCSPPTRSACRATGPWAVVDERGVLLAVYERRAPGTVKPAVVLMPAT